MDAWDIWLRISVGIAIAGVSFAVGAGAVLLLHAFGWWLLLAPVVLGVLYAIGSFFVERGWA